MKRIVSILLCVVLLVGCGGSGKISVEEATSVFYIEEEMYKLPMTVSELEDNGWQLDRNSDITIDKLMKESYLMLTYKKGDTRISAKVLNPESYELALSKGIVVEVRFYDYDITNEKFEVYGNIKLGEEFKGAAEKRLSKLELQSLDYNSSAIYGTDEESTLMIRIDNNLITSIDISNWSEYGDSLDYEYSSIYDYEEEEEEIEVDSDFEISIKLGEIGYDLDESIAEAEENANPFQSKLDSSTFEQSFDCYKVDGVVTSVIKDTTEIIGGSVIFMTGIDGEKYVFMLPTELELAAEVGDSISIYVMGLGKDSETFNAMIGYVVFQVVNGTQTYTYW